MRALYSSCTKFEKKKQFFSDDKMKGRMLKKTRTLQLFRQSVMIDAEKCFFYAKRNKAGCGEGNSKLHIYAFQRVCLAE